MRAKILIIDDEESLSRLVALHLEPKGFEVISARNARQGLKKAYEEHPDIIVLDVMMPGMDGWEACERLREISDVPILMLTAKSQDEDVIHGFRVGADDYLKKPFNLKELELRIGAILKRVDSRQWDGTEVYDDGFLRIDLERQQVLRNGRTVHLTPTEFKLLRCLVRHKGEVVPHETLLEEVWGPAYYDASNSLSLYVHYLREKIEKNVGEPQYIRTKWGVGYWFSPGENNNEEPGVIDG